MTELPIHRPPTAAGVDEPRLYAANAQAASYFAGRLAGHRPAMAYLRQRGIAEAAAAGSPWQLGYAPPGRRTLLEHLHARGYRDTEIYAAGLATRGRRGQLLDRFRDRLTFPVHDPDGRVVGFTARDLSHQPGVPKYLNTAQTAIYRKSHLLYGLGVHLQQPLPAGRTPLVIVVEGAADTLALWRMARSIADLPGTVPIYPVAPCGTTLTTEQLQLLGETLPAGARLAIAFDGDPAGQRAFTLAYRLLRGWPGPTYAITMADGYDPADLLAAHGPAAALAELAARMTPAARTALVSTLEHLHADGAVTDPRVYPADRQRAIEAIAGYFVDDPGDTAGLATAAAKRLGIADTQVVQAVIAHTFAVHPEPADTWASASTKGRRRWQTDAVAAHTDPSSTTQAWAIADGIGDRPEAAQAAALAVHTAARVAARRSAAAGVAAAGAAVAGLEPDGDAAIIAATAHPTDHGTRYELAWAGNVRAYTRLGGRLVQVTTDHTVAAQRRGAGNPVAAGSELEYLLTASVRHGPVARASVEVPHGGGLLLCTAGLYRHVDPNYLRQATGPVTDPHTTTHRLIAAADGAGENATVLLLRATAPTAGDTNSPAALARLATATPPDAISAAAQPASVRPPQPPAGQATTPELISYLRSLTSTAGPLEAHGRPPGVAAVRRR
jgi:DNA primase catalytic core